MDSKFCAGVSILSSILSFFLLSQSFSTSFLLSSTLYLLLTQFAKRKPDSPSPCEKCILRDSVPVPPPIFAESFPDAVSSKPPEVLALENLKSLSEFLLQTKDSQTADYINEALRSLINPPLLPVTENSPIIESLDKSCIAEMHPETVEIGCIAEESLETSEKSCGTKSLIKVSEKASGIELLQSDNSCSPSLTFADISLNTDLEMSKIPSPKLTPILTESTFSHSLHNARPRPLLTVLKYFHDLPSTKSRPLLSEARFSQFLPSTRNNPVLSYCKFSENLPNRKAKRPASSQTIASLADKESETRVFTADHESQTWMMQEDQEVNTTQTLLLGISEENKKIQTKPRSNSVDIVRDEFVQEKELLIGELVCERVTNKKGMVAYDLQTHIEADFPVVGEDAFGDSGKAPFLIGFINFADQTTGEINFEILKERFMNARSIKVRATQFKSVDMMSYIDDPDFQILFSAIFSTNICDVIVVLLDTENISSILSLFLSYKFNQTPEKTIFFIHSASNLESTTQEFTINLIRKLEINIELNPEKIGYGDRNLKLFHLEANKHQSFNFIEEQVECMQNLYSSSSSLAKSNQIPFSFPEFLREKLLTTLSYLLQDKDIQKKSLCRAEDYGYCVSVKYKNISEMPQTILFHSAVQNFIRVSPISISPSEIQSSVYVTPEILTMRSKPLSCLFLSLSPCNFQEILGVSKSLSNFVEIYTDESDQSNLFHDTVYNRLTSWVIGTYLADFIILLIDFNEMPDLHHSELLLKYFALLREIDKPLFILHKTTEVVTYEYSFQRITELLESTWASDRVLLHEEISENLIANTQKLESIKEQMNDNLFDPDAHFDISEQFRLSFDTALEKTMLIQSSRKRELMIKGEILHKQDFLTCRSDLESTWKVAIRDSFSQSALKSLIYVSPAQYHIDKNISATLYSTSIPLVQDHLVKISVFSNFEPARLSHLYLSDLAFCFSKNKDDTLLIFPSSRVVTTSVSNHLNTQEFNSAFLHRFMERVADCLVISLFYEGIKLIRPVDGFLGLSSMFKIRSPAKPILVFHQYPGEGEMAEYSAFFKRCVKDFEELVSGWTGGSPASDIRIHENTNEGIYAFDSQKQIIHRLIVPGSEIIWKWYNGVLYKIMHNAAIKNGVRPLKECVQQGFRDTLQDTVQINDDEERVVPQVLCADFLEKSWKAISSFYMTVYADVMPSWLINAI